MQRVSHNKLHKLSATYELTNSENSDNPDNLRRESGLKEASDRIKII